MIPRVPLILWIVLFSFLIRLLFLLQVPPPAVTVWGDDGYYQLTASQLSDYLHHGGSLLKELFKGNLFQSQGVLEKYGLEIPWGALKRGPGYPLFLAIIFWLAGPDPFWVYVTQAFLISLSGVFLYGIARELGQETVGLLCAALAGLYPPLIFIVSRFVQEAFSLFLFPLFYFLLFRCRKTNSVGIFVLTGLTLALLVLSRSALSYFPFFFAALFVSSHFRGWVQLHHRKLLVLGVSFLIPFLLWLKAVSWLSGQGGSVVLQAAGRTMLSATLPENDGWLTDLFLLGRPNPEAAERLAREGISVFRVDGDFVWPDESKMVRAAQGNILKHPGTFLRLSLNKFRRLWWQPYDWPWREFLFPPELLRWFHRFLVLAAIVGGTLWGFERPLSLGLLVIPVLYGSLVHTFYHIESRYGLLYFIFPILFASFFIHLLWKNRKLIFLPLQRLWVGLVLILTGCVLYHLSQPSFLLAVFRGWAASQAHLFAIGLQSFFLVIFFLLAGIGLQPILSRPRLVMSLFVAAFLTLVPFEIYAFTTEDWHQWRVSVQEPGQIIRQEIFLPGGSMEGALKQNLRMDLKIPREGTSGEVWVNGKMIAGLETLKARRPRFTFRSYAIFLREARKKPFEMRQWFSLPLPSHLLEEGKFNQVEIRSKKSKPAPSFSRRDEMIVFGDYPTGAPLPLFRGPRFRHLAGEVSVLKWIYDGDFRLNGITPLHHAGTRSSYDDGRGWRFDDLSSSPAIQTGEYRIRIEIERPKGKFLIY